MKNALAKFTDSYGMLIVIALLLVLFFRSCSTNNAINKLAKEVQLNDSASVANAAPTKQEIDRIVSERLYDFLIFEDDLDKKKTSLSDIKLKISQNGKK